MTGGEPHRPDTVLVAVVAAHRRGQPLHPELLALGARFERDAFTAPVYRMIALPGPGVLRGGIVPSTGLGSGIGVELHRMPTAAVGALVLALPSWLAIGHVRLAAGAALGMVCVGEPDGAIDISEHGSWPAYLASAVQPASSPASPRTTISTCAPSSGSA
jgi:allophanate hydrolase